MDTEMRRKVAEEKEMREWCGALPKVELHAHLNGSVRNSTLLSVLRSAPTPPLLSSHRLPRTPGY
jgi:adenosine deaminase